MSWESSSEYYRIINQTVANRLGGVHSADCLMYSFDFDEIEAMMSVGRWDDVTENVITAARMLESGGSGLLLICTNTIHKVAEQVQAEISIPLIHIADVTAHAIQRQRLNRVGLLGTRFTMEEAFYRDRLETDYSIQVAVPRKAEREIVHRVVFEELVRGEINTRSRNQYIDIMGRLVENGVQGIILGCTEIPMLVGDVDLGVPLFDTTRLHAEAAVDYALGD